MRLVVVVRDRPAAFGFTFVVSFSFLCWFLVNCFAFLFFWNLPFLLLQLPQIILNYRNLMAGNNSAFLAVPWLGMLTGLLGNLSLLSYFIKKKESEAVAIQLLGVVSIYVAILQLAMAEAMTLPHFVATSIVTASGVIINSLKHFDLLNNGIWKSWEEFITIAGLSALPQVIWSTFVPIVPNTVFPGCIALFTAVLVVSKVCLVIALQDLKVFYPSSYFLGAHGETVKERCKHSRISIRMDSHTSLHVDACCTNVDKSSESQKHERSVSRDNVAGHDWQRSADPTSTSYSGFNVVHWFDMGVCFLRMGQPRVLVPELLCGEMHKCKDTTHP
ncbi:uncharacterized protein LOC121810775 isoform X1 [Salvia splendens]|uniref:uncharacterized protein LOC121810775 isoform X1 n=2 Tax=Salvia splendens TaxID=180675 RepID=UPI001C270B4C|nr:uncharacterized protein LOC121810775 isoform X1 [Salvia splendens]